jgi:hypothetical protein
LTKIQIWQKDIADIEKRITDEEAEVLSHQTDLNQTLSGFQVQHPELTLENCEALLKDQSANRAICANINISLAVIKAITSQIEFDKKTLRNFKQQLSNLVNGYQTIRCKKGQVTLEISGKRPVCPKGYKK